MISYAHSSARVAVVIYQRRHGIYSRYESESCQVSEIMQTSKKLNIKIEDTQYTAEIQVLDQIQAEESFARGRGKLAQMQEKSGTPDKLTATRRMFESMMQFGDLVAEFLPVAKMVFVVCASAWDRIEEQQKSNEELEDLAGRLMGMAPLVDEVRKHAQLQPLLQNIKDFLDLIEDVVIFVGERGTMGFGARVLKSFLDSGDRDRVEDLEKRFKKIKSEFDTAISVQTMAMVARAREKESIKRLNHVELSGYDPSRGCQDGTRFKVLDDIDRWILATHPSAPLMWVYGQAGIGKSAISTSVCSRLVGRGTPVINFFCKRDDPALRDPLRLINNIAHGLAAKYSSYSTLVAKAIDNDPELCSSHMGARYEELLKKPLQELNDSPSPSPFVVVIDALDECGDKDSRKQLLGHLTELSLLVSWLKVIVTSRPDSDIRSFFDKTSPTAVSQCALHDYAVADDIRAYIEARLGEIAAKNQWPADSIDKLCIKAGDLFIWAATASKFILSSFDPEERLQQILEGSQSEGALGYLDSLYATVIRNGLMDQEEDSKKYVRQCIGAILAASSRQPLPIPVLERLMPVKPGILERVVERLGAVLYTDTEMKGAVRVIHPSFADFALNKRRSGDFWVDPVQRNLELSTGCVSTLERELRFNICELETSHLLNSEVPGLDSKIDAKISRQLVYSCIYWLGHLIETTDRGLADRVEKVIDGPQLLYWLEVLSLLRRMDVALHGLHELHQWLLSLQHSTAHYVLDAYRFTFAFVEPIAASAPHIYISALALAPKGSEVSRKLSPMFPNTLAVAEGGDEAWPRWLRSIAHPGPISALCASRDGQRLVTNYDGESKPLRVFDLRTGTLLRTLEHSAASYSGRSKLIALSPDSTTVASVSEGREVMLWEINTGTIIHNLLIECPDDEAMTFDASTFSPDGSILYVLVTISNDSKNQLVVWETGPGEPTKTSLLQDLEIGTYIAAAAFSPDATRVAIGNADGQFLIMPRTGLAMAYAVQVEIKHPPGIIAFSPDGTLIATAGDPDSDSLSTCTVQIWDAKTGSAAGGALVGHTGGVYSIAFSPDGARMLTGSRDNTVRLWDTQTHSAIGGPFLGHKSTVSSVAFSPAGTYIVSGSWDDTVLMWDASPPSADEASDVVAITHPQHREAGDHCADEADGPRRSFDLSGHSGGVGSVLFSLDGTRIISGSGDSTVRSWQAQTGGAIGNPLMVDLEVEYVALSSDGTCDIAAGTSNLSGKSLVWDARTGTQLPISLDSDMPYKCALSPDGAHLVTCIFSPDTSGTGIIIWDRKTGDMIKELNGVQSCPEFVAFTLDGSYMFSYHHSPGWSTSFSEVPSKSENKVYVWDPSTYNLVGSWDLEDTLELHALSPDGSYLVSSYYQDYSIVIHDAQTGGIIKDPLVGHTSAVCSIAFSSDGARMASGSGHPECAIRLWDLNSGTSIASPLIGHLDAVSSLAFSPRVLLEIAGEF
ncbi:hypothetical protein FRC11_002611 [Ceratobasidium sp. 423]|nr:hypothetical protein FRC11_002611 [Ceratobasidium sp. 423]